MTGLARVVGAGLAVGLMVGVAALSRVPVDGPGGEDARLRLSWKMPAEVVEVCRERTPEELDRIPVHMRSAEVCEGRATAYRLEVDVDGRARLRRRVDPPGLRGDRPISVFEESALDPGSRRVRVAFAPVDPGAASAPLVLEDTVDARPGEVVLVTLDDRTGRLVSRGPGR